MQSTEPRPTHIPVTSGARHPPSARADANPHEALAGTYGLEALAGAAVVVLTILALAQVLPVRLTGYAAVVAGGAFLVEGLGLGARGRQIKRTLRGDRTRTAALAGGVSTQILAGCAGITLGVLAVLGMETATLLAIATIVFGAAFVLELAATRELARFERADEAPTAYEAVRGSNAIRVVSGAAAIVLGVLALNGVGPSFTLITIAELVIGAMFFLTGMAIATGEATDARLA